MEIPYGDLFFFSCNSHPNQAALAQLEEQVGIINACVLKPLSECTEVPPDLESAVNNLRELVSSCLLLRLSNAEDRLLARRRRPQRDAGCGIEVVCVGFCSPIE